jgi:adenosine kinase
MTGTPVVISGSIAVDRIMHFTGRYADLIQPDKLDSLAILPLVDSLTVAFGGVGANIAYSLALLGEKPILLGSVGADVDNDIKKLQRLGVETGYIHVSMLPTATFTAITDDSQSQIGGFYPGAMADSASLTLKPWADKDPLVVVSPHDPKAMKRQVRECKQWSLRLCYDPGQQITTAPVEDLLEGIEVAAILMVNEYELSLLCKRTGYSAEQIKEKVPILVTTLGQNGSLLDGADVEEPLRIGVAKPQREADPTGAGDAYRGGFLYGFAREWPLLACAQFGAVTATYAVEVQGTQAHHFTFEKAYARYEQTFGAALPA